MSNLVVSDDGLSLEASAMVSAWNSPGLTMRLFKNNVTPTKATVLADFTEATFPGYAGLSMTSWGAPSVSAHVAVSTISPLTWTVSADSPGEVVYGYYVTNTFGTVLYWSERYDSAPAPMDTTGDTFTVNPQRSYESKFG